MSTIDRLPVPTIYQSDLDLDLWCSLFTVHCSARSDPISHPIISSSTSICYPFPTIIDLSFRLFLNQPHSLQTSHAPFFHHFIILLCLVLPLGLYQQNKIHRQIHQLINSLCRHVSPIHFIASFNYLFRRLPESVALSPTVFHRPSKS